MVSARSTDARADSVRALDVAAVDSVVMPFTDERSAQALDRALERLVGEQRRALRQRQLAERTATP